MRSSARARCPRAIRAQLMRVTIHLVSARDCLALHPITRPVLARTFKSPWSRGLAGADVEEVVAVAEHRVQFVPSP